MDETTSEREVTNVIWGAVSDVFFWSKIKGGMQRTGHPLRRIKTDLDLVESLKVELPLLLILDMGNEAMNAFAVIQTLKEDEAYKAIPILAFCNHDDVAAFTRAKTLGADNIVTNGVFSASMDDLVADLLKDEDDELL